MTRAPPNLTQMARSSSPSSKEVDFFSVEKTTVFKRQRSSHDIQLVTSKINPDILKTVIANASTPTATPSTTPPPLPHCDLTLRLNSWSENKNEESAPMTIFYNGKVVVFPATATKAYEILKLAERTLPNYKQSLLSPNLTEDLAIKRKRSLQKFMAKRAERIDKSSIPNPNLAEVD